jgi:hypothetical protein
MLPRLVVALLPLLGVHDAAEGESRHWLLDVWQPGAGEGSWWDATRCATLLLTLHSGVGVAVAVVRGGGCCLMRQSQLQAC